MSGLVIVITDVATASVFLAKGWSVESVSRVERTARNTQQKHEKERAEHAYYAYYSHIHDEVTVYDAPQPQFRNLMKMKISQKTQQHRMIRKMKHNSPCPNHCRHGDRFRRFMKTWDTHQIAHWFECYISVEPRADSSWQPPGTSVVLVRHRNVQPVQS